MFAANDVQKFLSISKEEEKKTHDYTLPELHLGAVQSTGQSMSERSFRRILNGLQIYKSDNGYYCPADAIVIIGWINNRHKYSSYQEYREREGKKFYQQAQQAQSQGYFYANEL